MKLHDLMHKLFAVLVIAFMAMPLSLIAQDDKKPDEKKDKKAMYVSPSWTADGNYIIVSKSDQSIGTFHPFMYHKDGGSGISVGPPPPPLPGPDTQGPSAPRMNRMGAVASPEGRYIYYA